MDWLKKHVDAAMVLGAIFSSFIWMQSEFRFIEREFRELDQRLTRIETVMIMHKIMPVDLLADCERKERK